MFRLAALAVAMICPAAFAQEAQPGDLARGSELARSLCRSCHLVSPDDRGPVPDGIPSFMTIAARPGVSEAGLKATLVKPHPVMPQPPLTTAQAHDVVTYILSLRPK